MCLVCNFLTGVCLLPWRLRSHLLNHEWIANSHEVGGIDCYSGCDASSCVAQHLRKRGQWQVRSTGWHSVREWLSMLPHMVVNQTTRCVVYAHVMCCCNAARGADAAEDKSLALALNLAYTSTGAVLAAESSAIRLLTKIAAWRQS